MRAPFVAIASLAVIFVAIIGGGCGDAGDAGTTAPAASEATPMPPSEASPATLEAGVAYRSTMFKPRVGFTLPRGDWETAAPELPRSLAIRRVRSPTRNNTLALLEVDQVFDPKRGGTSPRDAIAAPSDFASFLVEHPRLTATAPESAKALGLTGVRIDVEVSSTPPEVPEKACDGPCLPLYVDDAGEPIVFRPGDRLRYYVLDGPHGQLIAELYVSPGRRFDADIGRLEQALGSFEIAG